MVSETLAAEWSPKKTQRLFNDAMNTASPSLALIVPTRNRVQILSELLESIRRLDDVSAKRLEVIVADNDSQDNSYELVTSMTKDFPVPLRVVKIARPGKSAAVNDAVKAVSSDLVAFLDDDVVIEKGWLLAVEGFFRQGKYKVGQGRIGLQAPANSDPEILKLVQRYRTIPMLEHPANTESVHSLNAANFFMHREVFNQVGGLDERLGPGASGTSEDVDLARRLRRAGVAIGYAPQAVVYHRVDRDRLTEAYFKKIHRRQGASRLLLRNYSWTEIVFNICRALALYGYHALMGPERKRYRAKGRLHHYLAMFDAKRGHSST